MVTIIIILALYFVVMISISNFSSAENLVFSLSAEDIRELSLREDRSSRWLADKLKKPREFALLFVVARTLLFTLAALLLLLLTDIIPEWWFITICALVFWITIVLFGFAFPGGAVRGNRLEKALRKLPLIRFANYALAPFNILWKGTLRLLAPEGGIGGPLAIERELDALIPDENGFAGLETEEKEMIR
ncbi:MAG: CNNM domain-containing protein, partial [bacterium]